MYKNPKRIKNNQLNTWKGAELLRTRILSILRILKTLNNYDWESNFRNKYEINPKSNYRMSFILIIYIIYIKYSIYISNTSKNR